MNGMWPHAVANVEDDAKWCWSDCPAD
jgi:hypothetical protein